MVIDKKIAYVKKKELFEPLIPTIPTGLNPIVFIEDTREMWTCGTYFSIGYPSIEVSEESGSIKVTIGNSFFMMSTTGESISVRKGDGNRIILSSNALNRVDTDVPLEWVTADRKLIHKKSGTNAGTFGQSTNVNNASIFSIPNVTVDEWGHVTDIANRNVSIRDYVEQLTPSTSIGERNVLLAYSDMDVSESAQVRKANGMSYNDATKKLILTGGLNSTGAVNVVGSDLTVIDGYIIGKLKGNVEGSATPKIHLSLKPEYGGSSLELYGHVKLQDTLNSKPNPSTSNTNINNTEITAIAASPLMVWNAIETAKAYADSILGANNAMLYKGALEAGLSTPGTYTPAADIGNTYVVTFGSGNYIDNVGYINGEPVEIGDLLICKESAQASNSSNWQDVKKKWTYVQTNTTGVVSGPSASIVGQLAIFNSTTGKLIKGLANGSIGQMMVIGSAGIPKWEDKPDRLNHKLKFRYNLVDFLEFDGHEEKIINFIAGDNMFITVDAQGNITLAADPGSDTVNTAGATNKVDTKLFLIGAEFQTTAPQTYSNQYVYIGTDNCLYSLGKKVLTEHQAIYNLDLQTQVGEAVTKVTTFDPNAANNSFTLVQGTNVTLTPDAANKKVTISSKDTTYDFYNLVFKQGESVIDTYKPTTSPSKTLKAGTNVTFTGSNNEVLITTQDTRNTAGATEKLTTKLFLTGALTQTDNPQTYTNSKVYIGADNKLYSDGKVVSTGDHTHNYAGATSPGGPALKVDLNPSGLLDATYGSYGGILQDSNKGPVSGSWSNRIKILHNNSTGYYTELAQNFTGTAGLWHRRNVAGTISEWTPVIDNANFHTYLDSTYVIRGNDPNVLTNYVRYSINTGLTMNWEWGNATPTHIWGAKASDSSKAYVFNGDNIRAFANAVNRAGDTMTGTLKVTEIQATNGNGLVMWNGTTYTYLGMQAGTTYIRSGKTDLQHRYNGTDYKIWDARNLVGLRTEHSHNTINFIDSRETASTPQEHAAGVWLDFKANAKANLSDGGSYAGLLTVRKYGRTTDWTGGKSAQLGFTDNSNVWVRFGSGASWEAWKQLATTGWADGKFLPLAGGTVTGNIILKGGTNADMTNANIHPRLRFDNSDSSQTVSFIFTDYDSYRAPAGIKLVGNQGNEWFEAPKLIKTGSSDSYVLLGGGGHKALDLLIQVDRGGSINNRDNKGTNQVWFDYNFGGSGIVGSAISFTGLSNYATQICAGYSDHNAIGIRTYNGDKQTWNSVKRLWHNGNFDPNTKVNKAGDTMTGKLSWTMNGVTSSISNDNGSYTHHNTNASAGHWFNKNVYVSGNVYGGSSYNRILAFKDEINSQVGGSKSAQMLWNSWSTDASYGGAIQIREYGNVTNTQSAWGYSPAITFHWGNRYAKRFGMRSDGQFAVDDIPISLSTHNHDSAYVNVTGDTMTGRLTIQSAGLNGTYSGLLVGDNCYIGDCNMVNTIGIMGTTNNSAGMIKLGKSGYQFGYNGSNHFVSGSGLWTNLNADLLDGVHNGNVTANYVNANSQQTLSLTHLDSNTWYPCVMYASPGNSTPVRVTFCNALSSNVPSWSTHGSGFSFQFDFDWIGGGWGTISWYLRIYRHSYSFANDDPCYGLEQRNNRSALVLYMRGGANYQYRTTDGRSFSVYSSNTNIGNSTHPDYVAPRTSRLNNEWEQEASSRVGTCAIASKADRATVADSTERANMLSGHSASPDGSHPGYGAKVFYSWNIGQANNSSAGYSNGITIGSNPGDQAYGFQIVQNMWDDRTYTRRYNSGWQSWKALATTEDVANAIPSGTIIMWLGDNIPSGWEDITPLFAGRFPMGTGTARQPGWGMSVKNTYSAGVNTIGGNDYVTVSGDYLPNHYHRFVNATNNYWGGTYTESSSDGEFRKISSLNGNHNRGHDSGEKTSQGIFRTGSKCNSAGYNYNSSAYAYFTLIPKYRAVRFLRKL